MKDTIGDLLATLKQSPPGKNVFNPWRDRDSENDIGPEAPEIRSRQLAHYLDVRIRTARYLLIGEALGYQGGHFSGIAMTSERILLGYLEREGIHPRDVLPGLEPRRTSKPGLMPKGFTEPTATIVWGTLFKSGLKPTDFVLWNVFSWHPFDPKRGILSNRRPNEKELRLGYPAIEKFLGLFPGRIVVALGKISSATLRSLKVDRYEVRHPANAGAREFREQIGAVLRKTKGAPRETRRRPQ